MTLGEQRLGEIVAPAGFGALDLDERSVEQVVVGRARFAVFDDVGDIEHAFVDFFFVARIAAQQEVVEVIAIEHDLVADGFDGAHILQCA